jgi:hypothetical protein
MPDEDRISFALLLEKLDGTMLAYITCLETHNDTLYIQYGGAFLGPNKNSVHALPGYLKLIDWCKARYKRILTYISSKNKVMLKFAMRAGFEIVGVKYFKGFCLVDHALEVGAT